MSTNPVNFSTTTTNTGSLLQITGLASGLDTNSIINAMMAIDRLPETQLKNQQQGLQAQKTALTNDPDRSADARPQRRRAGRSVAVVELADRDEQRLDSRLRDDGPERRRGRRRLPGAVTPARELLAANVHLRQSRQPTETITIDGIRRQRSPPRRIDRRLRQRGELGFERAPSTQPRPTPVPSCCPERASGAPDRRLHPDQRRHPERADREGGSLRARRAGRQVQH